METILSRLEQYFKDTPREEIDKAWKEIEVKCKGVESPFIDEFLKQHKK